MVVDRDLSAEYRSVLGHFPTGVVVVTAMADGAPAGLTVQSFMALSLDPPMVLLSVDRGSTSWPLIAAARRFAVNVLASGQADVALSFARSAADKFAGARWAPGRSTGAPLLESCQAYLECEVDRVYEGGDHQIVTAHVLDLRAGENSQSHPLIFYRSRFPQLDRTHWDSLLG
ncbi:flavin reductase family protein [Mycolicibacterium sp. S2-37]|uniref:flavin reductase family protein n=1 Tax=Mycolicibacterium sp. S2-37 TaxID=2810297 RepID=UPI001F5E8B2B|nr:flavin reductase family protein [Mycolicibacterium sp. S2-37]